MEKNLGFRGWFYFRTGWATYFAFVVSAVNALTVTFFLAIENYPSLSAIFPTFGHYIVIVVGVGVPILVLVGYIHFKRSKSFRAEADVLIETNPHIRRILQNTEVLLPSYLKLTELMIKLMIMAAVYEFMFMHKTPIKVIIGEYLKVSDFFVGESQKSFLNAILDKASKISRVIDN